MPHKTCSLDCVYCECGVTTDLTLARKEYVPVGQVIAELDAYLSRNEKIDYITFSGSGEPTLHAGIGDIVQFLKTDYPQYKIALLTNSTLLDQPRVQQQVNAVDVVMASLDAATRKAFFKVNRPHPDLCLDAIVDGLVEFRKTYTGKLLIEVMLVADCNDSDPELQPLKQTLERTQADGTLLNTLDRPPARNWVRPLPKHRLREISGFLKQTEIIQYSCPQGSGKIGHADLAQRLVATLRRRPYTVLDLVQVMGIDVGLVQPLLDRLVAEQKLVAKPMERGLFYMTAEGQVA